ncbi:non-ribosomal peptide synthetase [Spongiactinospora sp. 9N601]|uniref:non-ribosomal peptide synthetase n=1 Tax=Spongiactinospora sp. 9N601 TaxID=3375149 RepID=UPI0037AEC3AF
MIIDLVRERACQAPEKIAVLSRDGGLTYGELWRRAGRTAHRLGGLGCAPGETVGVLAQPSADGVVGLLAVLRAGAAFLGLCPSLPPARVETLVNDSGARFVLHAPAAPVTSVSAAKVVGIAAEDVGPDAPAAPPAHPRAPAMVVYTSGSTGTPKAVIVPHRALLNRITWGRRTYPLGVADLVLHHTRYIYDFSIWEVLAPLADGATLVVESFRNYPDFGEIASAIRDFQVTTAHFVPSVLAGLLRHAAPRDLASLTTVFSGGEALPRRLAAEFAKVCDATLYNQYGPAETCVDSTFHRYDGTTGEGTVPIGGPIDQTSLYVLDARLRHVPEGETGELYIGGAGLASAYGGRPGLTAERFVADPFRGGGERMYRTGDLVRDLGGGTLQFAGRADWQLNVRGVRLEPAEIELALEAHPGVSKAVASVTGDGEPHLVALVVPEPGATVFRDELRDLARATLPAAAVPDRFYAGDTFPLLPTGKIDRRAVRDLLATARPLPEGARPANAAVSGQLLAIWRELLGIDAIGPHDDFFELGGHSLLAAELIMTANERLGTDIPLAEFFEIPTLAQMTALAGGDPT